MEKEEESEDERSVQEIIEESRSHMADLKEEVKKYRDKLEEESMEGRLKSVKDNFREDTGKHVEKLKKRRKKLKEKIENLEDKEDSDKLQDIEDGIDEITFVKHDFKNLSQIIGSCLDLAAEEEDSDKYRKKMKSSMDEALEFLEHHGTSFEPKEHEDLPEMVEGTSKKYEEPWLQINVNTDGLPKKAVFSKHDIKSLLRNLVQNSKQNLKENRKEIENPWIEVRGRKEGENIVLEVEDNGTGIPERWGEDQIFEKGHTTRGDKGGTGMGGYIVKNVAEMHDGAVEHENREEGGSRFRVEFPHREEGE